jgi:hypothetical protein
VRLITPPPEDLSVGPVLDRFSRQHFRSGSAEIPGPDGIRHKLVARIRSEIEAGTYDTEERWLAAEERLLARIG